MLLKNPSCCHTAFGLPLRTVDAEPSIFRPPPPAAGRLEGAQLQHAINLALGIEPREVVHGGGGLPLLRPSAASHTQRHAADVAGITSDEFEILSAEDGARARRLGCVCAAIALLLLALALLAALGGGEAAPDAATAVPIAVGSAGAIALLAATKWLELGLKLLLGNFGVIVIDAKRRP